MTARMDAFRTGWYVNMLQSRRNIERANGTESVLFVPRVGHLNAAIRLAVDSVGHITGGGIPISGMRILPTVP